MPGLTSGMSLAFLKPCSATLRISWGSPAGKGETHGPINPGVPAASQPAARHVSVATLDQPASALLSAEWSLK